MASEMRHHYPHVGLTNKIIMAAFRVRSMLGTGHGEKVYENALLHELQRMGIQTRHQVPVGAYSPSPAVNRHIMDLVVDDKIYIELTDEELGGAGVRHVADGLNAGHLDLGLVINFNCVPLRKGIQRVQPN